MPRLFTGIEIPAEVALRLSQLRGGLPGARWVDPENYHITLRFLGDIDVNIAHDVADLLARIRRRAFTLSVGGLGSFGGGKPRQVWARVPPVPELMALQSENEQIVQRAGLPAETRKFTPHVTLARLRSAKSRSVAAYLESRGDFLGTPFEVTRFVLFSSQPSRGGGPYIVEQAYPLIRE
ncbi:MAG TPA: RNA 2',3'-cyclic phosphodiesterase [Hyphomicrobiales bacterium]|nr:RNA 2',3'-cyclic phosphodiesterase [Hyphomicrobiales bacterium]